MLIPPLPLVCLSAADTADSTWTCRGFDTCGAGVRHGHTLSRSVRFPFGTCLKYLFGFAKSVQVLIAASPSDLDNPRNSWSDMLSGALYDMPEGVSSDLERVLLAGKIGGRTMDERELETTVWDVQEVVVISVE